MKKYKIDKSALKFGEPKRIQDAQYRQSYKGSKCVASRNGIDLCGQDAVGAHMNDEGYAGTGQKVSDDEMLPLCDQCHKDQHAHPGTSWWYHNVLKPQARRRYRNWKNGK
ncbi:MAG: hypothetical protein AAF988_07410 [Pseudomonadota bacterium]